MKKIIAVLLTFIFILSLASCSDSSDNTAQTSTTSKTEKVTEAESTTLSEQTSLDTFINDYKANKNFIKFSVSSLTNLGFSDHVKIEYFQDDSCTYYSFENTISNRHFILKYDLNTNTSYYAYNGMWIKDVDNRGQYSSHESFLYAFNLELEGNGTESTVDFNGDTYNSKHFDTTVYDFKSDIEFTQFDKNSNALVLTTENGYHNAIYKDIILADTPTEDSKISDALNYVESKEYYSYLVGSESMTPALESGVVYFYKVVDISDISIDDIVLAYEPENKFYLSHRVIDITDEGLILQGDNNDVPDINVFTKENVLGKLTENQNN